MINRKILFQDGFLSFPSLYLSRCDACFQNTVKLCILLKHIFRDESYLMSALDRESIAIAMDSHIDLSQCVDIRRDPSISEWISKNAWIIED